MTSCRSGGPFENSVSAALLKREESRRVSCVSFRDTIGGHNHEAMTVKLSVHPDLSSSTIRL